MIAVKESAKQVDDVVGLKEIKGMGMARIEKYGSDLLSVVGSLG